MPPMPNKARPDLSKEPQHKVKFFTPPTDYVAYYVEEESRKAGELLELPDTVLSFNSVVCRAIACGPDTKVVKPGDRFLTHPSLMAGLVRYQGKICYISQEAHIQGVLDAATADDPPVAEEAA